jgi:hypothetical protein
MSQLLYATYRTPSPFAFSPLPSFTLTLFQNVVPFTFNPTLPVSITDPFWHGAVTLVTRVLFAVAVQNQKWYFPRPGAGRVAPRETFTCLL